jgi:hypothetical protein
VNEELKKLKEIIEALPPQLRTKMEAIVKNIVSILGDLGDATEADVWDGKTFSSSNGIRLKGTLSVSPDQIRWGETVHDIVGRVAVRGPLG